MKVSLIQMDIAWEDPEANRAEAERLMLTAGRSDLYVLPEMWNTGVTTEPHRLSECLSGEEGEGSESLWWMQRMANTLDAAVAGSIAVRTTSGSPVKGECQYRNRLYFVMPQETAGGESPNCKWYDKHHLFAYGGETEHYTPGCGRVTVEWRGLRFRLSICYDLRFPLWLRNSDGYDVLLCVASWPKVRMHAWNVLLQARAIENQCYVLGVNRIGNDPYCAYQGGTAVVNPFGFATSCPDDEAFALTEELDMKRLGSFRRKFPVLTEQDTGG